MQEISVILHVLPTHILNEWNMPSILNIVITIIIQTQDTTHIIIAITITCARYILQLIINSKMMGQMFHPLTWWELALVVLGRSIG